MVQESSRSVITQSLNFQSRMKKTIMMHEELKFWMTFKLKREKFKSKVPVLMHTYSTKTALGQLQKIEPQKIKYSEMLKTNIFSSIQHQISRLLLWRALKIVS